MADENLHAKHRARMQERVERDGLDSLAEHEALEYLLFLSIRGLTQTRWRTDSFSTSAISARCWSRAEELMQVEASAPKVRG